MKKLLLPLLLILLITSCKEDDGVSPMDMEPVDELEYVYWPFGNNIYKVEITTGDYEIVAEDVEFTGCPQNNKIVYTTKVDDGNNAIIMNNLWFNSPDTLLSNGKFYQATLSPEADKVAFIKDLSLYIMDIESKKLKGICYLGSIVGMEFSEFIKFSPSGQFLSYVNSDNSISIYNYEQNEYVKLPVSPQALIHNISFSPNENKALLAGRSAGYSHLIELDLLSEESNVVSTVENEVILESIYLDNGNKIAYTRIYDNQKKGNIVLCDKTGNIIYDINPLPDEHNIYYLGFAAHNNPISSSNTIIMKDSRCYLSEFNINTKEYKEIVHTLDWN